MSHPVYYDITAADQLTTALTQLNDKLHNLAALRARERANQLGDPSAPQPTAWTGQRRGEFERSYSTQQDRFGRLADSALLMRQRVATATDEARQNPTAPGM